MNLKHDLTPENLKVIEIKQIALNKDKFGALTFDNAYPKLNELRKVLVEFDELGYKDLLTPDEVNDVNNYKDRLIEYVKRINNLDPATDITFNKSVKESLENEVDGFYKSTLKHLRPNLVFLRQEAARKSQDHQSLAEEQKAASQARKQAEETLATLHQKLEQLNTREKDLENTSGKVGAKALGIHFNKETTSYENQANRWLIGSVVAYVILISSIVGIAIYYTWWHEGRWSTLTWQESAAKLALFAVIWYAVSFIVRNYNVNSHLAAVNRHRAAVARTLEDFLNSAPARQSEMLKNATEAMFKHVPIGYITKAEKDSTNPILEVVNKVIGSRSE